MAKSATTSPILSLPKGGGALHGIGETFSPDLFTGTGNFSVPIALPPGRNGFQPELSLGYSTGNGNGPFGLGWTLSTPGVSRKSSKGLPRYRDDSTDPDDRDTFILSGAEDLVPVFEVAPGLTRYRPRTEGLFARIEHHHGTDPNHWEVHTKDGLTSFYGTKSRPEDATPDWEDPAIIANPNPEKRRQIFAWKLTETRDTFRNRILYEYERDRRSDGLRKWDQLYLKRIRYVEYRDAADGERFLISVSFNYEPDSDGEDLTKSPPERLDAFSDHRAGFEIRTCKRCKSLVIETQAETTRRVRTYELIYMDERVGRGDIDENSLPFNGVSLLSQIRVTGLDDEQPLEKDRVQQLPPLEFGYSQFEPEKRRYVPLTGPNLPPRSLGSPDFELADLFGNSLPDVVEMNGAVRYWRNRGDAKLDLPRDMTEAPAGVALADAGVQLLDANGDGRIDLLVTTPQLSGFYSTRPEGLWDRRSFQRYRFAPSINLQDPNVQLVDLDGDGVTDAIRSGATFELFFNDPLEGWNQTRIVPRIPDTEEFPNVSFSDPRVRWADLSGDGLQDIVLIHSGNVEYWPHLGYGNFGKRIRMANSPIFEDAALFPSLGYDPKRVLVGDVDGDGVDDIIYVGSGHITIWINQCGNAWSDPITIQGTPLFSSIDDVRIVDMLGSGTAGVLWTYDSRAKQDSTLKYLDLTGGTKPYVLTEMNNHMGAVTRVEYASSTQFYLADDKNPHTRWKTTLPFPVLVVSRVEVVDTLSRGKLTTEYKYHHGYWDGAEREFRGFGRVDQLDTENFDDFHGTRLHEGNLFNSVERELFSPPTETRTWFHLGPVGEEFGDWGPDDFYQHEYHSEFFTGDPSMLPELQQQSSGGAELSMLDTLPRRVKRDAIRALRGRVIRTELYARDGNEREGRPFTVTEFLHGVCGVHDDADGSQLISDPDSMPDDWMNNGQTQRVFFAHPIVQRTTQWERGDDRMTRFSFTEDYDEFGQPRRQTDVACPRKWGSLDDSPPAGDVFLATQTQTVFATPLSDSDAFIHDRIARVASFEVLASDTLSLLDLKRAADQGTALNLIGQTLNFYDGEAFEGLPNGEVAQHGALVRSENLVLTEQILREAYEDDGSQAPSPEIPLYLAPPGSPPAWTDEYPLAFREHIEGLPPLTGFTFYNGDGVHRRGYFASSARSAFDFQIPGKPEPRGLLRTTRDAFGDRRGGGDTLIEYDEFDLLPMSVTDPVGLVTKATYDSRVLQPIEVTDPNHNRVEFGFTPLGFVKSIAALGKENEAVGDTKQVPGMVFEYKLAGPDEEGRQPISVRTIQRIHHVNETDVSPEERDQTVETIEYSDGFGRVLQTRTLAEDEIVGDPIFGGGVLSRDQSVDPGALIVRRRDREAEPNVVVSGWQVYDNKGRVVQKFESFFDQGFAYLTLDDAKKQRPELFGQKIRMFYDPLDRLIRTVNPDGSEQRVLLGVPGSIDEPDLTKVNNFEPTPWIAFTYDANDLAPLSQALQADGDGPPLTNRAPAHHHFTPSSIQVDGLGRTVLAISRNRESTDSPIQEITTRSEYDIRGNLLQLTDALNRDAFTYVYDLANNAVRTENVDAGVRRRVLDSAGNEIERRDSKGALILRVFDRLHRPSRVWARDDGATALTLRERLEYGDGGTSHQGEKERDQNRALNRLGFLHRHYDEAGLLEFKQYDFKGNVLEKSRRVIRDSAILGVFPAPDDSDVDWRIRPFRVNWDPLDENVHALLDDQSHDTSASYDALNRIKLFLYPRPRGTPERRKELRRIYNRAGGLERVILDNQTFVERIAYNAKGQRTFIALGNRVMTLYAYEPQTFRLARMVSVAFSNDGDDVYRSNTLSSQEERKKHLHQDFVYDYDLAGNIVAIRDRTPESGIPDTLIGPDALDRKFEYDAIYRLIAATGRECERPVELPPELYSSAPPCRDLTKKRPYEQRYRYDSAGNMEELQHLTSASSGFVRRFALRGGTNQLLILKIGEYESKYVYDPNGNMKDEDTSRHFEWDHSDRMRVFRNQTLAANPQKPGDLTEPTVYAQYLYDSDGMRVKKVVRKQGGKAEVTEYIDGIFDLQRASGMENQTVHIRDDQRQIATERVGPPLPDDATPAVKYALKDHLNNSNVVLSVDGEFINREEFTPYGETGFGSFVKKRYRFAGKEKDEESGLHHHAARSYAPWLSRWLACDPAGPIDGPNLYAYSGLSPITNMDELGLQAQRSTNIGPESPEYGLSSTEAEQLDVLAPGWRESVIRVHGFKPPDPAEIELKLSGLLVRNRLNQREWDYLYQHYPKRTRAMYEGYQILARIGSQARQIAAVEEFKRWMRATREVVETTGVVYASAFAVAFSAPWAVGTAVGGVSTAATATKSAVTATVAKAAAGARAVYEVVRDLAIIAGVGTGGYHVLMAFTPSERAARLNTRIPQAEGVVGPKRRLTNEERATANAVLDILQEIEGGNAGAVNRLVGLRPHELKGKKFEGWWSVDLLQGNPGAVNKMRLLFHKNKEGRFDWRIMQMH